MGGQVFIESFLKVPSSKEKIKDFLKDIPKGPGVYKFLDKFKHPIYIGKAKNLRNRLSSYFRDSKDKKLNKLIQELRNLELVLTSTELEALLMEQYLIKEFKPKFNVQFKDDKGYPWIRIDISKEFPSAKSFLGKKDPSVKLFGPYPSSKAVQESLKLLQKTFQIRNCSDSFFRNRTRPCIQHEIGRCSAPCVGLIKKEEYLRDIDSTELLLNGKSEELISSFYNLMDKYSQAKQFEKAASFRDKISSLRDIQRIQSITGHLGQRDAISVFTIHGVTKAGITHVNGGWVTGHENFLQKNNLLEGSVMESFIKTYYLNKVFCPPTLIIGETIKNKKIVELALSEYHGKRIKIISKLGIKDRGLLRICENNTKFSFKNNLSNKNRIPALDSLTKELSLSKRIDLIESYDISHHSGTSAVAGCVVYSINGRLKEKYRLFNISKENSGNDIASMVEVIERRFNNQTIDMENPNLIILDGGKVHLSHVVKKLKNLNLMGIHVISISKGARRKSAYDSIHLPNGSTKKISTESLAHKFIQEIRDEAHRFSLTKQKKKQKDLSSSSSLDELVGVGPKRKNLLIRYFGSIEQLKRASSQDLINVPGLGKKTASSIYNQLK